MPMDKNDILEYFSAKTEEQAKRNLYKYTNCGAFIEFEEDGIVLGSIVEGSDEGTTTFNLKYSEGITEDYLENIIGRIENEASLIWDWANKVEPNGLTPQENGQDWPLL